MLKRWRNRRGQGVGQGRRLFGGLALAGLVLGLGASGASGCVVFVTDEDDVCDVGCGFNAFCDVDGRCQCEFGYEGDPTVECDPVMEWRLQDECEDGLDVEFRLWSLTRGWGWPESPLVYVTPGLGVDTSVSIRCELGETICFGARAGEVEWGVGLDNDGPEDGACFLCDVVVADMGLLTCGS